MTGERKSYPCEVVGESHYQAAISRCAARQKVTIAHEPENQWDKKALVVRSKFGDTIGYIPRDSWIHRVIFEEGGTVEARIMSIHKNRGTAGVVLRVYAPEALAPETTGPAETLQKYRVTVDPEEEPEEQRGPWLGSSAAPDPDDDMIWPKLMVVVIAILALFAWAKSGSDPAPEVAGFDRDKALSECEYELKKVLGDPESFEADLARSYINYRPSVPDYLFTVKYRVRNAFGGRVLNEYFCTVDENYQITGLVVREGATGQSSTVKGYIDPDIPFGKIPE